MGPASIGTAVAGRTPHRINDRCIIDSEVQAPELGEWFLFGVVFDGYRAHLYMTDHHLSNLHSKEFNNKNSALESTYQAILGEVNEEIDGEVHIEVANLAFFDGNSDLHVGYVQEFLYRFNPTVSTPSPTLTGKYSL